MISCFEVAFGWELLRLFVNLNVKMNVTIYIMASTFKTRLFFGSSLNLASHWLGCYCPVTFGLFLS